MNINLNIDTKKINEAGTNIVDLSFDLLDIINNFYERINNIPTKTGEWVGKESVYFASLCMVEKEEYVKFISSLKAFGENLISFATNIDNQVNCVENELCQK